MRGAKSLKISRPDRRGESRRGIPFSPAPAANSTIRFAGDGS
jgi:hypothetical protein